MLRLIYRWLKAGYQWNGEHHDTDQGSPQGGVISPLLANVYLHEFDQGQAQQKSFVGRLVRFADDFVIQCGTAAHAERALTWARAELTRLGLRLHPEKTRVVQDREGFDFLGFHHRRVRSREAPHRESWGVMRWPGAKACRKYRERVRYLVGPPGRLRAQWKLCLEDLERFLRGWCQYYRHGQSAWVFAKLERYTALRIARNRTRSQPKGKGRKRRTWQETMRVLGAWGKLPRLRVIQHERMPAYRGQAKVEWRAG